MRTLLAPELADVEAVVEEVWRSFVGEVEPLLPGTAAAGAQWSANVSISGTWEGSVTVEVADAVAIELTRRMLGISTSPVDEDVADAVGEVVNMIGGNIKSLLPGPSTLSLPAVAAGRAAFSSEAHEVSRYDALWRGDPVRVSVHAVAR